MKALIGKPCINITCFLDGIEKLFIICLKTFSFIKLVPAVELLLSIRVIQRYLITV